MLDDRREVEHAGCNVRTDMKTLNKHEIMAQIFKKLKLQLHAHCQHSVYDGKLFKVQKQIPVAHSMLNFFTGKNKNEKTNLD